MRIMRTKTIFIIKFTTGSLYLCVFDADVAGSFIEHMIPPMELELLARVMADLKQTRKSYRKCLSETDALKTP